MLNTEQLKAHYNGIGGSMASSILGLNKYQSNIDAYLLLTDESYRAKQQAEIGSKLAVKMGNALEELVAEQVGLDKGWKLAVNDETLVDQEHPFLIGHVDRFIVGKNELVEIKTRGAQAFGEYGDEDTDQIQDSEYIQIMHYLMLTGYERGHLAVLRLGTAEVKYYIVERNEEVIANMRESLVDFWHKHVLAKVPPKPLAYKDALKLYPDSMPIERIADNEIMHWAKDAKELSRQIKELEKALDLRKAAFADYLQNSDTLIDSSANKILTFKIQSRACLDLELLRAKYPAIAAECSTTVNSRVMRFNPKFN
jgi:putative phage-type endonuclease